MKKKVFLFILTAENKGKSRQYSSRKVVIALYFRAQNKTSVVFIINIPTVEGRRVDEEKRIPYGNQGYILIYI